MNAALRSVADDEARWEDACLAATLFAIDPVGLNGVALRVFPGQARDRWLQLLQRQLPKLTAIVRVPLHVTDARLLGGLDLAATMRAGKPVAERGILAAADGGIVLLAMAERLTAGAAARLTAALDTGEVVVERDGFTQRLPAHLAVVALDEGLEPEERPPAGLLDRLALHIDLGGIPAAIIRRGASPDPSSLAKARAQLANVRVGDGVIGALCQTAAALGVDSARASWLASRVARAAAALAGRVEVSAADATLAARLVLAPRATRFPSAQAEQAEAAEESESDAAGDPEVAPPLSESAGAEKNASPGAPQDAQPLEDRVLAATQASLPQDLLARLQLRAAGLARSGAGRAGAEQVSRRRGRPVGVVPGDPATGARVNVIETLRAAAPWQRLRRARSPGAAGRIQVRKGDFRVTRFKQRTQTTSIFLVDASGSSALNRLGEVKGAVELLLADCYVRRDRVALIAFRGRGAQLLLAPTRSLVRAKRGLADLPGGGGTPLASGVDAARVLADSIRRRGETAVIVIMTDGRANVARDGRGGRQAAEVDALQAARLLRMEGITTLLVDTAPQPRELAATLAREMGARYLALPYADAASLAGAVRLGAVGAATRRGS